MMSEQRITRLTEAVLAELERQLPAAHVTRNTTELEAGQMIGIQMVLNKLRHGLTIPD